MNAPTLSGPHIVIVAYKPKPGMEGELLALTREHVTLLREEGLATDRSVIACQAADGTIVEVFEWAAGGVEKAHTNARVGELWGRYFAACDVLPLGTLGEAGGMFASLVPIEV